MYAKAACDPDTGDFAGRGLQGLGNAFAGPGGGAERNAAAPGAANDQPERIAEGARFGREIPDCKNGERVTAHLRKLVA